MTARHQCENRYGLKSPCSCAVCLLCDVCPGHGLRTTLLNLPISPCTAASRPNATLDARFASHQRVWTSSSGPTGTHGPGVPSQGPGADPPLRSRGGPTAGLWGLIQTVIEYGAVSTAASLTVKVQGQISDNSLESFSKPLILIRTVPPKPDQWHGQANVP